MIKEQRSALSWGCTLVGIVCARACTTRLLRKPGCLEQNIEDTVHAARGGANKVQGGGGQMKHHMQWHAPQELG
eukprot:CAMPEP_0179491362 /NCGR_PEP_ID=MMETSP0799-20121207/66044_1 /TAXON_ID=46947 /ORGANISM="Geminigera cryophila, Strain CCMP2564" /LENGTH=73 /DNA_ID=CAMNT_0021307801 /DNA_START=592 /DNA_END=813 /DNA_ORIENTATION=+